MSENEDTEHDGEVMEETVGVVEEVLEAPSRPSIVKSLCISYVYYAN